MANVRKTGASSKEEADNIQKTLDQIHKMTKDDYIGGPIKAILDGQEMARKRTEQFMDDIGYKKK